MAYAVVKCGGKQVRVSEGSTIRVEKLSAAKGASVDLREVLLYSNGDEVRVGRPTVPGVRVVGTVVSQGRAKKLTVFKDSMRKSLRRRRGHRQAFTELRIEKIVQGG